MKRENKLVRTSINLFTDSGMNRWNLEERGRERENAQVCMVCVRVCGVGEVYYYNTDDHG